MNSQDPCPADVGHRVDIFLLLILGHMGIGQHPFLGGDAKCCFHHLIDFTMHGEALPERLGVGVETRVRQCFPEIIKVRGSSVTEP
ncbi:MAG TPA: hypothetical protein DCS43_17040 [Verrucomicrobia bacterium]|nr:hypothetical protein [Verrucomicrobiota bacterium]